MQPTLPEAERIDLKSRFKQRPTESRSKGFSLTQPFSANLSRAAYEQAFNTIQDFIVAGDCYQVNLARRFKAGYQGTPWSAYKALRLTANGPFSGFLDAGDRQILSFSPERFLSVTEGKVQTRPIKGTRPRSHKPEEDARTAEELLQSKKDRAENLMIVDLLRNDIGKNCAPGSVSVDELFGLESYPAVHHLVSTISGRLTSGHGALDLLRDCFPGGSITGAPKRRAMEVIAMLEPDRRGPYCGSLFYIEPGGNMDSNITIRTLLCEGGEISCWGGGGLVADSTCETEYQETWDKVGGLLTTLETTLRSAL